MGGGWGRRWIFRGYFGGAYILRNMKGVMEILLCVYIYPRAATRICSPNTVIHKKKQYYSTLPPLPLHRRSAFMKLYNRS